MKWRILGWEAGYRNLTPHLLASMVKTMTRHVSVICSGNKAYICTYRTYTGHVPILRAISGAAEGIEPRSLIFRIIRGQEIVFNTAVEATSERERGDKGACPHH